MNTPFTSLTNCKLQMYEDTGFVSLFEPLTRLILARSPAFRYQSACRVKKERTREKICEPNLHTGYHNQLRARDLLVPIKFSFRSDRRFLGCDVQRRHLRVCRDHLFTLVVFQSRHLQFVSLLLWPKLDRRWRQGTQDSGCCNLAYRVDGLGRIHCRLKQALLLLD